MPVPPPFGVGRIAAQDRIDQWIAAVAPGRSFVDIGGIGEQSGNERCSWARRCGAGEVVMADILPETHALWRHFRRETETHGVRDIAMRPGLDIDAVDFPQALGRHDIVHATGLLYHCPHPVHSLLNLRRVVGEYLITNTVVIPDVVENAEGRVAFPASSALFLPALRGRERAVLRRYYLDRFQLELDQHAPMTGGGMMPYLERGAPSPWPYWWFFTKTAFERALELLEMRILDRHTWQDHAHFVFLRRK
ncbi:hypothetical protein KTR66_23540 [Roseococcus sp. SDR]|uniref:hypothetical protein n=1 Tax=Roseococcus sp. SDR TaxID=2835532 RepID=UPI001BCFDDEF|nr:hypothetical protein [Roseococcus sp. SDR]MBS7792979.1 hypothetical protein [Roseococcus sp. SDR]MBV1848293.1 hypothetical protein [Roseococcus sp. SDR]